MKLISAGAGLLFLVMFGLPVMFVTFGIAWAMMGWWSIPVVAIILFLAIAVAIGDYIQQQDRHSL